MRIDTGRWRIHAPAWRHPAVRTGGELTLGERAADRMRTGMGSWPFVFCSLAFLAGWMAGNGRHGFDPYPFILLNLILSCIAALQGAILLIAARRADQVSAELAQHNLQMVRDADHKAVEMLSILRDLRDGQRPASGQH